MVLLSYLQTSGAEIRGIWILPFCVGDRARASNWFTTPLAILCLTKHWHPGLSMTNNLLSFLSWIEIRMDFQGCLRLGLGLRIKFTFCALSAQSPNDQRVLMMDIYSSVSTVFVPSSRWEGPEVWRVGPPVGIGGFPRCYRATGLRK